ncbi:TniB family NTP-binding protein [Ekhidna sp.]
MKLNEIIRRCLSSDKIRDVDIREFLHPDIKEMKELTYKDLATYYTVDTSSIYKGIVPNWYFYIVTKEYEDLSQQEYEIKLVVSTLLEKKKYPLIFINKTVIDLTAWIQGKKENYVYEVPYPLISQSEYTNNFRNSLISDSIRAAIDKPLDYKIFKPYNASNPVTIPWKFFGRSKHLKQLMASDASIILAGGRKLGKTSLLNAFSDEMEQQGHEVYQIEIQGEPSTQNLTDAIVEKLDARNIIRNKKLAHEYGVKYLRLALDNFRKVKRDKVPIIIIDELGNVLINADRNDWNVLGVLRDYAQSRRIRFVFTAFQEILIRQHSDPNGPLFNFGKVLRVTPFNENDIKDLILSPLKQWINIENKEAVLEKVKSTYGYHPLILSYLGEYLFDNIITRRDDQNLEMLLENFQNTDDPWVENALKSIMWELFESLDQDNKEIPIEKFLYLEIVTELISKKHPNEALIYPYFDVYDLLEHLNQMGFQFQIEQIKVLVQRLELRGHFRSNPNNHSKLSLTTPLIYHYKSKHDSLERLIEIYRKELLSISPKKLIEEIIIT